MINWIPLQKETQIAQIIEQSSTIPCLIFKHSSTCDMSAMSRMRLETDWSFKEEELICYFLDILTYRNIAQSIAEEFHVEHESPQVLLIRDGFCSYDASHMDISVEELKECYHSKFL